MGNQNSNKKEKKDKLKKSFTLCPLIKDRKLLNEKKITGNTISCLGVINHKNKDFILIGFDYGKFEIFDSITLESIIEDHDEIKMFEYMRYVGQLSNGNFVIVSQEYIRIYAFYSDDNSSNGSENNYAYNIKLLQKINDSIIKIFCDIDYNIKFAKAFIFNRDLYREYDIYEMEQDKYKKKNNKNTFFEEELIISSNEGIFIYEKIKENNEKEKENEKDNFSNKEEENENNNKFDIYSYIQDWKNNPYILKDQLTKYDSYDMIQVNYKYIAGTIKDYLCLYSMEAYEVVTKFSVKISEDCDSVIFMLNEDILCVAGDDTISLISIMDFEILLVSIIKKQYRITEICILPDWNILIGMRNKNINLISSNIEYFYQYKCFHKLNQLEGKERQAYENLNVINKDKKEELSKSKEYDIIQVSSKLLTKNYSNITMRCLSNNRLVTIIDLVNIQVWE